jgi:translocation and assembly module TamB
LSTAPLPPDYNDAPNPEPRQPPRRRWKTIIRIIAASFIIAAGLLLGFILLLHNYSFRQRLLRIALPAVSRAVGADVRIRDFSLQLLPTTPSLNIDALVIDSDAPSEPPLLEADHLDIGLQIVSIMKRNWYFNNVTIDRPVLRLRVDQNGHTNLPMRRTSSNRLDIFDLGIRHALVRKGELYYNDTKSALDAALYNVEIQARFDPQSKKYSGRLSYENGRIRFRDLKPIVHSLKTDFEATPEALNITHCTLTTGSSEVSLVATLNDYVHPKVNGTYQASLDSADLEQILHSAPLASGVVKLAGAAQFEDDPNKTVLETLSSNGNMNSTSLHVHSATINTEVRNISAEYLLHGGDIDIRNLRAELLGGALSGSYSMHDLNAAQESELHAVLKNADLSAIQSITNEFTRAQFRLSGDANLTLDANWRRVSDAFAARASADLKGSFAPLEGRGSSPAVPFDGSMQVAYSASAAELTFTRSYLRMPQTILKLSGSVSKNQSLQVQVQSDELHEVEAAATAFGLVREPVELYGAASFTGRVQGSTEQPLISGQLFSPALKIRGTRWRMLRATLDASPSHLALHNAEVRAADSAGRLAFDVNVPLDRWSYTGLGPFQVDLTATQLNVSQLMNMADSKTPATGTLSANVSLRGSKDNLVGQGTVTLTQATVANETVQSLTLNFRGDGDVIRAHLNTLMATGKLQGDVTYFPKRRMYDGQLQATNINLNQLQMFRTRGIHVAGSLDLNARGTGSLDNPGLDFTAHISQPQIENYKLGDISVEANIANRMANFVFDSQAPYRSHGRGSVQLTGAYLAEATVDTAPISLAPLLAIYLPARATDLNGQIELHAMIKGPLKNPSAIDGHITIPIFSLTYRNELELANAQPIDVKYNNGVLTLQRTRIYGIGTNIQLEGSFPVVGTGSISLIATGDINLHVVQIVNPDITSSGELEININGYGQRTNPNFKGQIRIVDASFAGSGIPVALEKGNGVLNLVDSRLNIDRFQGRISNGAFSASGSITYRPSVQFNLIMAADGIRLAYPPTVRTGIDANLTLTGSLQSPALKGQVRVNELSFTQAFDIEDALNKLALTKQLRQRTTRNLNLDITVQSSNELNPTSRELTLSGAANLRVRGTITEPALLGSISLNGGELLFRGDRYILQPSTVDFVNPAAIEPRLNVAVETRVSQYNIKMLFRGPIDDLRATFSSDPPLPPADTINLLVFGKTAQPVTTDSTGNLGAVALLASGVTSTITSRLQKVAGISQLSIDPVLDNDAQGSTVGVNVQQRVTANLFVTFTSDPSSEKRQVIEVEYQATPRLSVNGVVNRNGGFAADIRIRKTW